jgi:hypothetical protein
VLVLLCGTSVYQVWFDLVVLLRSYLTEGGDNILTNSAKILLVYNIFLALILEYKCGSVGQHRYPLHTHYKVKYWRKLVRNWRYLSFLSGRAPLGFVTLRRILHLGTIYLAGISLLLCLLSTLRCSSYYGPTFCSFRFIVSARNHSQSTLAPLRLSVSPYIPVSSPPH